MPPTLSFFSFPALEDFFLLQFSIFYLHTPIANLVKISSAVSELLTLVQKDERADGRTDGRTDSAILIGALQDEKTLKDKKKERTKRINEQM